MTTATAVARWMYCLAFAAAFSCAALAQEPQGADADPPVRVGRVSYVSGAVSFSPAGNDQWVEARLNRPVVTGDSLWVDADARAELATDNSTWWFGDSTSVTVTNLDDRIVQMEVQQGVVDVRVRRLPSGNLVEIDTPNLAFSVTRPGLYRIEVDPREGSTTLVVQQGTGEVYGESASYVIDDGQAYRFYGTDVNDSEFVALPPRDAFDHFVEERDRRYASAASLRYVSPEVIGYEDLDTYGSWSTEATYGNVWFPRDTQSGWAPYREGHWAWIDPWGWTWVDDEPWGFAPFHYGRWAHFSRGWGWVPGPRSVRAVYAPALVVFVGGAGFSLSASSGPAIGWFPLGPREVYVPPYRVSRNYFRQVNVSNTVVNVTNITNIYNNPTRVSQLTYANRRAPNAVTAVPPAAFAQAQNVRRAALNLPATALQRAEVHPVAPVAPARTAFLGAAPAAQARPPAAAINRAVVAKAPPPPRPVADVQKLPALERNPGRPLSPNDLQTLRRAAANAGTTTPSAKIVSPPKPAANAAPPARPAGARRPAQEPGAGPGVQGAQPQRPLAPPAPGAAEPRSSPGAEPKGPPAARAPQAPVPAAPPAPGAGRNGAPERGLPPGLQRREAVPAPAPEARPTPTPPQASPESRTLRPPQARPERQPAPEAQSAPQRPPETRLPGRPASEARPQPQPAPQSLPAPETRSAPQRPPQSLSRPQPAPEAQPRPAAPEARSQPAPQRAPEARAQPQRPPEAARLQPQPQRPPEAARPQPQLQRPPEAARPQPQLQRPPEAARPQPQPQRPPEAARPQPQPQRPPEAARLQPPPQRPPEAARPQPQAPRPPAKDQKGKDNDRNERGG